MLYEVIGIVRPGNLAEVREVILSAGNIVLRQGGVVRSLANWGVFDLPRKIVRHQQQHRRGHWFVMRYDASVAAHQQVRGVLDLDPRVVRAAHAKLGTGKLEDMVKFGKVRWNAESGTGVSQRGPQQ